MNKPIISDKLLNGSMQKYDPKKLQKKKKRWVKQDREKKGVEKIQ